MKYLSICADSIGSTPCCCGSTYTPSCAGSNFLLLFLDLGELLCIVASYRCLSKYVTLKTTKPGEKEK